MRWRCGFVVGGSGAVVLAYGLWLIAPAVMLLVVGLGGLTAGVWMVWAGNRGEE
jgi:hypothetical protein